MLCYNIILVRADYGLLLMMKSMQSILDKVAISISFLCIIHCLLLPVLLLMFPVLLALPLEGESFHQLLVILILPTSLIALIAGCRKHNRNTVMVWGMSGLLIVFFAALFGHDTVGELGEKILTLLGSLMIAWGHYRNFHLCRSSECH